MNLTPRTKKPSRKHDWSEANRQNPDAVKYRCRRCHVVKIKKGDTSEFWRDGDLVSTGRSPVCEPARLAGAPSARHTATWSLVYLRTQRGITAEKWPADMPVNETARNAEIVERFDLKPGEAAVSIDELITLYPRTRRDEPPAGEPVVIAPSPPPSPQGAAATAEVAQ